MPCLLGPKRKLEKKVKNSAITMRMNLLPEIILKSLKQEYAYSSDVDVYAYLWKHKGKKAKISVGKKLHNHLNY